MQKKPPKTGNCDSHIGKKKASNEKMTSEVDGLPKMLDLTYMIIYSVFLTSWTFAYESHVFLSWAQSYASFKN